MNGFWHCLKGFSDVLSFSRCNIDFGRAGGNKRSIGQWNGWDVRSKFPCSFDFSFSLLFFGFSLVFIRLLSFLFSYFRL